MKVVMRSADVPGFLKEVSNVKDLDGAVVYGEIIALGAAKGLLELFSGKSVQFEPATESEASCLVPYLIGREQGSGVVLYSTPGKLTCDYVKKAGWNVVAWSEYAGVPKGKSKAKKPAEREPVVEKPPVEKTPVPEKKASVKSEKKTTGLQAKLSGVLLPIIEGSRLSAKRKESLSSPGALALLESAIRKSPDTAALEFQMRMTFGAEYEDLFKVFAPVFSEVKASLEAK